MSSKRAFSLVLFSALIAFSAFGQLRTRFTSKQSVVAAIAKKRQNEGSFSSKSRFDAVSHGPTKPQKTLDAIFTTDLDGTVWFADGDSLPIRTGEEKLIKVAENFSWYFLSSNWFFESKTVQQRPKTHERGKPMRIDLRFLLEHDKAWADFRDNEISAILFDEITESFVAVDGQWQRSTDLRAGHQIKPFEISAFEVTVSQFELFIRKSKYITAAEKEGRAIVRRLRGSLASNSEESRSGVHWRHNPRGDLLGEDEDNLPVVHLNWEDAQAFCKWMSEKDVRYAYRLPTVKEWEIAAACGQNARFPWGNDPKPSGNVGNMADLSLRLAMDSGIKKVFSDENDGHALVSPVGAFEPNGCGFFDMAGNVAEWCEWDAFLTDHRDGEKPFKGGSYFTEPAQCAIEKTFSAPVQRSHPGIGFRLVRTKRF